jgi:hypothetical protein
MVYAPSRFTTARTLFRCVLCPIQDVCDPPWAAHAAGGPSSLRLGWDLEGWRITGPPARDGCQSSHHNGILHDGRTGMRTVTVPPCTGSPGPLVQTGPGVWSRPSSLLGSIRSPAAGQPRHTHERRDSFAGSAGIACLQRVGVCRARARTVVDWWQSGASV